MKATVNERLLSIKYLTNETSLSTVAAYRLSDVYCILFTRRPTEPPKGIAEMIQAQPVLDTPTNRMLTYALTDIEGAKVIVSVRASLADDDLIRAAMEMIVVPRYPGS